MPLYEYKCTQCQRHTEKIQKFSDPEITKCPHCGGPLERVLSAPAISFKGGGWFKDGYSHAKSSGSKDGGKSEPSKPAGSAGDISASSKSDSASGSSTTAAATPAPASSTSSADKK
jgi:putative FmdB family regulatory protein